MAQPKHEVQYPQIKGSEQHYDLKNDAGKKGDPDQMKDEKMSQDDGTEDNSK